MSTAVQAQTGADHTQLRHILRSAATLGAVQTVLIVAIAFATRTLAGGVEAAVVGLLLAAAILVTAFVPGLWTRARTIEGVSGLMNLVMMPMWVLSGVFFASSNFPDAMQPFIQLLPLTALNDALRGVINEGLPLGAMPDELAVLAVWGVLPFVLALRLFRWQ